MSIVKKENKPSRPTPYSIFDIFPSADDQSEKCWTVIGCTSWFMDSEVDSIILWPNVDDEDQDALWSHISKPNKPPGEDWVSYRARLRRSFTTLSEAKMRLPAAIAASNVTTSEPDEPVPPGLRPRRKAASKPIIRLDPGQPGGKIPSKFTSLTKKSGGGGRTSKEDSHTTCEKEEITNGSVPLAPEMTREEEKELFINGGSKVNSNTQEAAAAVTAAAAAAAKQRRKDRNKSKPEAANPKNGKQKMDLNDNYVPQAPAMTETEELELSSSVSRITSVSKGIIPQVSADGFQAELFSISGNESFADTSDRPQVKKKSRMDEYAETTGALVKYDSSIERSIEPWDKVPKNNSGLHGAGSLYVTTPSNTLPRTLKHEEAVEKDLTHLKLSSLDHDRSQETLSQQIAQMQKSIEALGKKKREESDDDEDFSLPLRDSVDFDAMNRKIEKSRRSRKVLFKQLDTAGGNGKSAIVREILKRLIHKSLGKSMTWVGRGGTNVAFGDTPVAEIIIQICAKKNPSISKTEVVAAGGAWFRHQKDPPKPVIQKKPKETALGLEESQTEEFKSGRRAKKTPPAPAELSDTSSLDG